MSKKWFLLAAVILLAGLVFISCAPDEEAEVPVVDEEPEMALSEKHGGTLRSAYYAPTNLDPAFLSTVADDQIGRQWSDFLVFIDEENQPMKAAV